jgi:surfeit locus 1 family protein
MLIGNKQFSPGLWPTIITMSLLPLLLSLGFWQLDRAEQKSSLLEQNLQRSNEIPVKRLEPDMDINSLIWRKTVLTGRFRHSPVFLLDNQVLKGQTGYLVYSLFDLQNKHTVLVNRGWIKARATRDDIPLVDTPQESLEITGTIKTSPATGILLAENTDEDLGQELYRLQNISPEKLVSHYKVTILPYIVRLDMNSAAGYIRDWRQPGSGREKHLGYAFQWFAMASALLIIFLAVNLKKNVDTSNET